MLRAAKHVYFANTRKEENPPFTMALTDKAKCD